MQLWQWGAPLGWVFVLWHTSIFSQMLPYFLASQDLPGSSCIFPGPSLESISFPRSRESFSWKLVYEIKIWVLSLLKCYKVVIAPSFPQQTQVGNMYTQIYLYFYIYLSAYIWSSFLTHEFISLVPIQHISSF